MRPVLPVNDVQETLAELRSSLLEVGFEGVGFFAVGGAGEHASEAPTGIAGADEGFDGVLVEDGLGLFFVGDLWR